MKKLISVLLILSVLLSLTAAFAEETEEPAILGDVSVQFGSDSAEYILHMYDTDTGAELYRNVTDSGRNLPSYDIKDYEGWEYFQFYDIPSYYSIPDGDQQLVESEKAGELYYCAPNRIILFYEDAEIPLMMVKVGYIEDTPEFRADVANNQPLDYWGNLLFIIRYAE